ncbi:MAG: hypothetical protein PVG39_30815, partial [Desulfobacteraceae bacterium]
RVARKSILDRLRGMSVPNAAMQKGIDFESNVVLAMDGKYVPKKEDKYSKCVNECSRLLAGSIHNQFACMKFDGFILEGWMDFIRINRVFDLKTTKKYTLGKYINNFQHRFYLYCLMDSCVNNFTYLITDFRSVYREDYQWEKSFVHDIRSGINGFMDYLDRDKEMKVAYLERHDV